MGAEAQSDTVISPSTTVVFEDLPQGADKLPLIIEIPFSQEEAGVLTFIHDLATSEVMKKRATEVENSYAYKLAYMLPWGAALANREQAMESLGLFYRFNNNHLAASPSGNNSLLPHERDVAISINILLLATFSSELSDRI